MTFRKTVLGTTLSLVASFAIAAGTPVIAPDAVMLAFEGMPSNVYTAVTTTSLGTAYVLRSDAQIISGVTVQDKLAATLYTSGKPLGKRLLYKTASPAVAYSSVQHQRIDETAAGSRNQCVAFAKAMTGVGATSTWIKGAALMSIFPNGRAPSQWQAEGMLRPGTMIANFVGSSSYPNTASSHVAIVKNVVADGTGNILGVNAYDQNGIAYANISGTTTSVNLGDPKTANPTGGTIIMHFIPWVCSGCTQGSFSASNYNVVNKLGKLHQYT